MAKPQITYRYQLKNGPIKYQLVWALINSFIHFFITANVKTHSLLQIT